MKNNKDIALADLASRLDDLRQEIYQLQDASGDDRLRDARAFLAKAQTELEYAAFEAKS